MDYRNKSDSFEDFLTRLNDSLDPHFPSLPTTPPDHIFAQIVGLPRSGTTILYQLLARTRAVGYPSNVMAPFWRVPVVGARLQEQLAASEPTISMTSVAGRTREPLDPHEFGYFWREALGHSGNTLHPDVQGWPWTRLQDTLDAVCEAFDKPTVYKNFLALTHVPDMRENLTRSRFLVMERDPRDAAASLWAVRQRIGVPEEATFGIDPGTPEHTDLVDRIVTQVTELERHRAALLDSSSNDNLRIRYEDLCRNPRTTIGLSLEFMGAESGTDVLRRVPEELPLGQGRRSIPESLERRLNETLMGEL